MVSEPSTPLNHSRVPLLAVACLVAGLLAACGGSGSGDKGPALSGVVVPAVSGLTMAEFDHRGLELQRSSPTDESGRFQFSRARGGVRVESIDGGTGKLRVRSAQLSAGDAYVTVTPLTTLVDQFAANGMGGQTAESRVLAAVNTSCAPAIGSASYRVADLTSTAVPSATAVSTTPSGSTGPTAHEVEVLMQALGAYIDALANLGFDPQYGRDWWPGKVEQHREVLAEMCATAAIVWSGELELAVRALAGDSPVESSSPINLPSFGTLRDRVLTDVTAVLGKKIALREYPELGTKDLLGTAWAGSAPDLAASLIKANMADLLSAPPAGLRLAATNTSLSATGLTTSVNRAGDKEQSLDGVIASAGGVLRVVNTAAEARSVRLAINGTRLGGLSSLLLDMLNVPVRQVNEPLYRRAWRYLSLKHRHDNVITGGRVIHEPLLYLRSVGAGLCDDVASALHFLWKSMGYQTRVIGLEGHVVPEVLVDGRWELYDPDLKHYFVLQNGQVANYHDIERDPGLLIRGARFATPSAAGFDPSLLMSIYASTADNREEGWFEEASSETLAPDLIVPPGAHLELTRGDRIQLPGAYVAEQVPFGAVRLWLPPGYSGTLEVGLMLADVVGEGRISSALGSQMTVTGAGISTTMHAWFISNPDNPIGSITVHEVGPGGMTLVMSVNQQLFDSSGDFRFRVYGAELGGLRLVNPGAAI